MAWYDVNQRIVEALGLSHLLVRSAVIRLASGEIPTVEVEIELTDSDGKPIVEDSEILTELRRYELVEREAT